MHEEQKSKIDCHGKINRGIIKAPQSKNKILGEK